MGKITLPNPSLPLPAQGGMSFPCEFVIKVFGLAANQFEINILLIIRKHIANLPENAVLERTSKTGKYLALSITLPIDSREQLDAIYRELSSNPAVLMAL
jgi:putative lipoic acid-binding regulatory protein